MSEEKTGGPALSYKEDWLDLGAGLGLLTPEYSDQILASMKEFERTGNSDDLEHYTAVAICILTAKNKLPEFVPVRWSNLVKIKQKDFHVTEPLLTERSRRLAEKGEG